MGKTKTYEDVKVAAKDCDVSIEKAIAIFEDNGFTVTGQPKKSNSASDILRSALPKKEKAGKSTKRGRKAGKSAAKTEDGDFIVSDITKPNKDGYITVRYSYDFGDGRVHKEQGMRLALIDAISEFRA